MNALALIGFLIVVYLVVGAGIAAAIARRAARESGPLSELEPEWSQRIWLYLLIWLLWPWSLFLAVGDIRHHGSARW